MKNIQFNSLLVKNQATAKISNDELHQHKNFVMKSISLFTVFIFCFLQSFAINTTLRDTVPANIKNYTKAQFLSEYGKDETSQKIIRYYFYRSKNARISLYIFPALTMVTTILGILLVTSNGGGLAGIVGIGALLYAVSFIFGFFEALNNRKKYSPIKLYNQLINYHAGNPLPKKLKRQIRFFIRK